MTPSRAFHPCLLAVCVFSAPALAADQVELLEPRVTVKKGEEATVVLVEGEAKGAPDGTAVQCLVGFKDQLEAGVRAYAEVTAGRYAFELGAKKVLPGTYQARVSLDPRAQRGAVNRELGLKDVAATSVEFVVGTPNEAEVERGKILRKYTFYLDNLQAMYQGLAMWGDSTTSRSAIEKIKARGRVPEKISQQVLTQWRTYTRGFRETLPTLRHDLNQFSGYVLVGYWPDAETALKQIMASLDAWHASYSVMICKNLGVEAPPEIAEKGKQKAGALRSEFPKLSARAYKVLGIEGEPWFLADANTPERTDDIQGEIFLSTVSKFMVRKPGPLWVFDTGPTSPTMRIRMRHKDMALTKKLVSGVELRDYPLADNYEDLARLDEFTTRHNWPGFELIKSERIEAPDPTMPNGIRPGQVMHYWIRLGEQRFYIVQYALFCRWQKRTYNLMSFAEEGVHETHLPTFEAMAETFFILDLPDKHKLGEFIERQVKILSNPKSVGGQGSENSKEGAQ